MVTPGPMMMTRMPISTGRCEMEITHLRARLRVHRLRCKVRDGEILIVPVQAVPDDLRILIAEHRDALMLDVGMLPDPAYSCCFCGALLPPSRSYVCADHQQDQGVN